MRVKTWWGCAGDWFNRPLFAFNPNIRIIDGMMVLMGAGIFSYYCYVHNWQQAMVATLSYILVWMVAAWML